MFQRIHTQDEFWNGISTRWTRPGTYSLCLASLRCWSRRLWRSRAAPPSRREGPGDTHAWKSWSSRRSSEVSSSSDPCASCSADIVALQCVSENPDLLLRDGRVEMCKGTCIPGTEGHTGRRGTECGARNFRLQKLAKDTLVGGVSGEHLREVRAGLIRKRWRGWRC